MDGIGGRRNRRGNHPEMGKIGVINQKSTGDDPGPKNDHGCNDYLPVIHGEESP